MRSAIANRLAVLSPTFMLLAMLTISGVAGARCQITSVSYAYPQKVLPKQLVEVDTRVAGSCVSNGFEYYELRVDLTNANSTTPLSTTSTPIGYAANNFVVTARNTATAPTYNTTWHLQMYVYIIRAGGTSGSYLFDYSTVGNATIQVGAIPVPEFESYPSFALGSFLILALLITCSRLRIRNEKRT